MNAAFCFNVNSNRHREIEVLRLSNQFYQYIERIKIALDYMKENVEDLNLDAYFGVLIAKCEFVYSFLICICMLYCYIVFFSLSEKY